MDSKKIIIFDLDGVLFDSPKLVSDHLLTSFPTVTKEELDEVLCGNFHEELEKLKLRHPALQETPEEKEKRSTKYSEQKKKVPLYDGVQELLNNLYSKGYILTINTSALERNCLPLLESSGIKSLFDFIATTEVSKSKVEKFKIIQEKYSVSNKDMLFITDTLGDIREADVAGIPTITVTWGAHTSSFFTREPHKNQLAIVNSVKELGNFIETYFK